MCGDDKTDRGRIEMRNEIRSTEPRSLRSSITGIALNNGQEDSRLNKAIIDEPKPKEVSQQMEHCDILLQDIAEEVKLLAQKIQMVLNNQLADGEGRGDAPDPTMCHLAGHLYKQNKSLADIREALQELRDRVEL